MGGGGRGREGGGRGGRTTHSAVIALQELITSRESTECRVPIGSAALGAEWPPVRRMYYAPSAACTRLRECSVPSAISVHSLMFAFVSHKLYNKRHDSVTHAPSVWRSHAMPDTRLIALPPCTAWAPPERNWACSALPVCTTDGPSSLTRAQAHAHADAGLPCFTLHRLVGAG